MGTVASSAYAANRSQAAGRDQARAATNAANASVAEQQRQFDAIQRQQQPFRDVGIGALNQLSQLYGLQPQGAANQPQVDPNTGQPIAPQPGGQADYSAFLNSPDYQFALQQGGQAVDRSAAARGGLMSGNTLAASQQYGQGLASQQLGNYTNNLMNIANFGQGAANSVSQAAMNAGNNNSNALLQGGMAAGNARASGAIGAANAIGSGLNQLGGIAGYYGQQNMLSQQPYGGAGYGGAARNTGYNPRSGGGVMYG